MIELAVIIMLVIVLLITRAIVGQRLRYVLLDRFGPGVCRLRGHHLRSRKRVKKIGEVFTSRCRICGVTLEKTSREGQWEARMPSLPTGPRTMPSRPATEDGPEFPEDWSVRH